MKGGTGGAEGGRVKGGDSTEREGGVRNPRSRLQIA